MKKKQTIVAFLAFATGFLTKASVNNPISRANMADIIVVLKRAESKVLENKKLFRKDKEVLFLAAAIKTDHLGDLEQCSGYELRSRTMTLNELDDLERSYFKECEPKRLLEKESRSLYCSYTLKRLNEISNEIDAGVEEYRKKLKK